MTLADRIAKIDARIDARKGEREAVRLAMPGLSAAVDDLRAKFGAVKVTYAKEGETRISVPFDEHFPRRMNADEWLRYVRTGENWGRVAA